MIWLSPANLIWLFGHLVLFLLGIIALGADTYFPSLSKPVAEGIGGSLIATGVAGEVLFLYVMMSDSLRSRLELFTKAGLVKIFPHRSVRIRDEYERLLTDAKEIDILGFGQSSFRQDFHHRFRDISKHARVRVLLIDPNFPNRQNSIANIRDTEEGNNVGQIREDVEAFERTLNQIDGIDRSQFQIRHLRALPSISIFRIDDLIFWGPYLIGQQSRNTPTLQVQRGGFLFESFSRHFDTIWNSDKYSSEAKADR